ncbi:hypothetical protein E8E15_000819 [Penicillium rubens]|nr:hypothetical protein E8E15_000819 [Penicillium rubens]
MAKSSNEKRALLKQQCREALAAHIHDRLGLVIAPAQVRLQPPPEDGYAWSVTEPMAFLLQSNLSSGTVGLLQTICKELGRSLEAVSPQVLQGPQSGPRTEGRVAAKQQTTRDGESDGSFTAKLHSLECANHSLSLELDRTRTHLEESNSEGRSLRAQICALQTEMETVVSQSNHRERELVRARTGIAEAMQLLQAHLLQNQDTASKDDTPETLTGPVAIEIADTT